MNEVVAQLYETIGVDVNSFSHRVRVRWNRMNHTERKKVLEWIGELDYTGHRWDALPEFLQTAILRAIKRRRNKRDRK